LEKEQSSFGFTAGHFMLIAACIVALLGFAFLRGDVTWAKLTSNLPLLHAASTQPLVTYDQALAQAKQQLGMDNALPAQSGVVANQQKSDVALLDASSTAGSVLGASTEPLPSVDELFTQEKLDAINVNSTPVTNQQTVQDYFNNITVVEINYNAPVLLSAFAAQNSDVLSKTHDAYLQMIADLRGIPVPAGLVTYHKMKLVYYSTLASLADSMSSGDSGRSDSILAGNLYFELSGKVDQMETQLKAQYGIN